MCHACNAAYMRNYRKMRRVREVRAARNEGSEAMRITVVQYFEDEWGGRGELNGLAVAEIVRYLRLVD